MSPGFTKPTISVNLIFPPLPYDIAQRLAGLLGVLNMECEEESKKRPLSTPSKPPSKKGAHFKTPARVLQKFCCNSSRKTHGEPSRFETTACRSEERKHEQVKATELQTTSDVSVSTYFCMFINGSPLLEAELLLYALVNVAFPENAFNFKAKSPDKYDPIIKVIDRIYQIQFKKYDLTNYFYRSKNNLTKNLGKMKGILRWVYYKDALSKTVEKFNPLLNSLLCACGGGTDSDIEKMQCSEDVHEQNYVDTSQENCVFTHEELSVEKITELCIFKNFPNWKVNYNSNKGTCHLFYFSGNDGYAKVEVIINSDLTWFIALEGKVKHTANLEWADASNFITNVSELERLMLVIESCKVCKGCPFEPFEATVSQGITQPIFYTKSKEPAAYVETNISQFHQKVIRSTACKIFLLGVDEVDS